MRKTVIPFLLVCAIFGGSGAFVSRPAAASGAQAKAKGRQADEQWQTTQSRDLGDSIWTEKRKSSKQESKRRRYRRAGVASSSTVALKYEKPSASGFVRRPAGRPSPRVQAASVWKDVALASAEQVGVTIWRLRPCADGGDGQRCFLRFNAAGGQDAMYEAVRVTTEADFRVGDGVQLAVESPVKGYIYVIHQEVFGKDQAGAPKLLYPLCKTGNSVGPGRPLLIPRQVPNEGIKVLRLRNAEGKNLLAERLKIIITRKPMDGICVQNSPHFLVADEVRRWESLFSGRLELFDLEGGDRESMTHNEWAAMRGGGERGRDLTEEDLAPQKLYLVERKQKDGVLITLDLPYGNARGRTGRR